MKKYSVAAALFLVAIPVSALAAITNSNHDLRASAGGGGLKSTHDDQICAFCHVPHNAEATKLLWSRQASATAAGWGAGSTTTAGTSLPVAVGSTSQACMTCHDGTVAIGDLRGTLTDLDAVTMIPAGTTRLGTNLNGTHPVSVPYKGATYNGIVSAKAAGATDYITGTNVGCTSASGWCTTTAAINLFGTAVGNLGIECSSCHDVHNTAGIAKLLLTTNAGSALCLGCHVK